MKEMFLSGARSVPIWLAQSSFRLIGLNAALLMLAVAAGWLSADLEVEAPMTSVGWAREGHSDFWQDATFILQANLRVLGTVLLGACTLGLLSVIVVIWNGYGLGFGLAMLSARSPEVLAPLMGYLPLEFAAIVLTSASSMVMARSIVAVMLDRAVPDVKPAGYLLALSLVLILLAAFIEAGVKQELASS